MSQPIKIQLNHEAMMALFPQGSDAQIELRSAVREALIKSLVQKHIARLTDHEDQLIKQVVDHHLRSGTNWNGPKLSPARIEEIRAVTRQEMLAVVTEELRASQKEFLDSLHSRVQQELDRVLNTGINGRLKAAIREVFAGLTT